MSLAVEVAGFGISNSLSHTVFFIICVQQENYQAWTVYRQYATFQELSEQMQMLHPGTEKLPIVSITNKDIESLEHARSLVNNWLQSVVMNPLILRTQSMYQFLCSDANSAPPHFEPHYTAGRGSDGGFEEDMEMEDMYETGDMNFEDNFENDDMSEEDQDHYALNSSNHGAKMKTSKHPRKYSGAIDDDDDDGIDIHSISVGEAEFMYDEAEEAAAAQGKPVQVIVNTTGKKKISLDSFQIYKVIGKGSFGKVFLVKDKARGSFHAMKVLKKDHIIKKNQVEHTKTERSVLGYIRHPFIVGLSMAFQTSDKLFFVLDYCAGGELFFHLGKVGRFPEERSKFYAAQITLALEHVHSFNIIYRDLKPENVLLDALGNVKLTDFGLSKEGVSDPSTGATSFCGTPEYIAPEVLLRQGHGKAVDWWSLGALLFEMIAGLPPFYSRNRETMFEKIAKAELTFPSTMTDSGKDILRKLLKRDPKIRLGSGERDALELKEHAFFQSFDWVHLADGTLPPPWVPAVVGSLDVSQFDPEFTSMMPTVSLDVREAYFGSLDRSFEGFSFVDDSTFIKKTNGSHHGATGKVFSSSYGRSRGLVHKN